MRKCRLEQFEEVADQRRAPRPDFIRAKARVPATSATLGLCSFMLGEGFAHAQQAAPASQAITLEQIDINGTGGSAYNPRESQITRLPTPIIDTPQTITVIPKQLIEDQKTSTLVETLHNVPGISFLGGEGGTQGDNINIRGYSARNDFYRDGIRDPGWYTRDTFSVEEVEVLKGPSSFLFGRGSTGGVVNMTSKLPEFRDFTTFEASGYTSPGGRGTIDVNRAWGDIAGRIVVLGNDTELAGRDFTKTRREGVAPSLKINMTPDNRLTLSYIYQRDNNVPDYGIPLLPGSYFGTPWGQPAPVPRGTYYGQSTPGFADTEQVNAHIGTAKFEHDINADWKFSDEMRYSYVDRFVRVRGTQIGTQAPGSTNNLFSTPFGGTAFTSVPYYYPLTSLFVANTNFFQNRTINSLATNQADITGHFNTLSLQHTFAAGIEADYETRSQFRTTYNAGSSDRVNIADPNPYPIFTQPIPGSSTEQYDAGRTVGLYLSDQIKINKYLDIMAGLRYDDLRVDQFSASEQTFSHAITGAYSATTPFNVVNKVHYVSWRTGAVLHPVENSSVYFMYGTSFDPSSEYLTITGGQQNNNPTTNETYEVGAKYDMFDSKLSATGALFKITQQNAIETINSAAGQYAQVGTTRVEGGEVGIAGKVTEKWSLFGGYTYMDGRVKESAPSTTSGTGFVSLPGNKLQDVPRDTFTLTSNYEILPGLTLGGSAYYTSDRYTSSLDVGRVPGYWRFDTLTSYKFTQNFSMQLNVLNILDTKNFETLSGFGAAQPGTGRAAIISAKYTF